MLLLREIFFFILGTSGTGKSVLLKTLVGLLKPDSGEVLYEGKDISRYDEEKYLEVRKECCMVFQQPALFDSLNIFENIAFGLRRLHQLDEKELKDRVEDALSAVDLEISIQTKYPSEISYGMQKRVGIARSLCLRPKVLLFDEPTTGLDPVATNGINALIKKLSDKYQTTSLVVSHDMKCALEIADRIVVLDKGQIIDQGKVEHIKQSKEALVRDFLSEALNAND